MTDLTGAQSAWLGPLWMDTLGTSAGAIVGISTIQAVEGVDGPAIISGGGIAQTLEHRVSARATALEGVIRVRTKARRDAGRWRDGTIRS